jgi:ParB family chromosome partitioning protein
MKLNKMKGYAEAARKADSESVSETIEQNSQFEPLEPPAPKAEETPWSEDGFAVDEAEAAFSDKSEEKVNEPNAEETTEIYTPFAETEDELRQENNTSQSETFDGELPQKSAEELPSEQPVMQENYISEDELKKFVDGFVNSYFTGKSQLIEPERLKNFHNYSFSAISDEKLLELAENIDNNGMENYVLVRSIGSGEYEIISGHSRVKAAGELCKWEKIPCIVGNKKVLTEDIIRQIISVTNLHRISEMTASEKIQIIKSIVEIKGEEAPFYLRMTSSETALYLACEQISERLVAYVGTEKIPMKIAAEKLTLLDQVNQEFVAKTLEKIECRITDKIADELVSAFDSGILTEQIVEDIITEKPKPAPKIHISMQLSEAYFRGKTAQEAENIIALALERYFKEDLS